MGVSNAPLEPIGPFYPMFRSLVGRAVTKSTMNAGILRGGAE